MKQAWIVTDLGYGDCGKGTVVDALSRRLPYPPVIVRHNGGPQAAHNVVWHGAEHTFSQFGSGMFVRDALTYLSRYMLINPLNMDREEIALRKLGITDAYQRTFVNYNAVIITPYQKAMNRITEMARGRQRHGSCGQGIGVTMADTKRWPIMAIRAKDCLNWRTVADKLEFWRQIKMAEAFHGPAARIDTYEKDIFYDDELIPHLVDFYSTWAKKVNIVQYNPTVFNKPMIFEGAQGVLLDEWRGFHPYTTWSTTTTRNARWILDEALYDGFIYSIGVIRSYQTRHGPGPFVTEDAEADFPELHNGTGMWQGDFRKGWLDLVATKYAIEVSGGIDKLAITHLDRTDSIDGLPVCTAYDSIEKLPPSPREADLHHSQYLAKLCENSKPMYTKIGKKDRAKVIADMLGIPLFMESWGPTAQDKIFP